MKTVVIIHGTYGSPNENWFPWLRDKVVEAKHVAKVPSLPTPEGQSIEAWRRAFDEQVGPVGRDTVLVGHSLGATFICDLLERTKEPVHGAFFVSGFVGILGNPKFDEPNRSFVTKDYDWRQIRKRKGAAFAYYGDDDPYVPQEKLKEFAEALDVKPRVIKKGGHLNESVGFVKFEGLWADLGKLLNGRKTFF